MLGALAFICLQEYDFDYEEDDQEDEADAGIENKYYNAKGE